MMKKYFYYIVDQCECELDAIAFKSPFDDIELVAEDAAAKEWSDRDGWEWMADGVEELVLLSAEKKEIGRFTIEFEAVPTFSAAKKEKL